MKTTVCIQTKFAFLFLVALSGCADEAPGAAPAEGLLPPGQQGHSCAGPDKGCPCDDEGAAVACGEKHSQQGASIVCAMGERRCQGGRWGVCEPSGESQTIEEEALGLRLSGLGPSSPCVNNPCNPYCNQFKDDHTGLTFPPDAGVAQSDAGNGVTLTPNPGGNPGVTVTGFRIAPKPSVTVTVTGIPMGQYPTVDVKPKFTGEFLCGNPPGPCSPPKGTPANWTLSSYQNMLINSAGEVSVIKPVPSSAAVTGKAGGYTDTSQVNVVVNVPNADGAPAGIVSGFALANQNPNALPLDTFSWLYPYKNTLFPRGLTAPVAQTDFGSLSGDVYVRYTLRHRKPDGSVDFSWSRVTPQTNPPRYSVPQHVWQYFDEVSSNQSAELVIQRATVSCPSKPDYCKEAAFNGKNYRFCASALDWNGARNQCMSMGMDLVNIGSDAENNFVSDTAAITAVGPWWMGYNDQVTEGNWAWSDGAPTLYTRWSPGEPNNSNNEDCGEIYAGARIWNDAPCPWGRYYVCEEPAKPTNCLEQTYNGKKYRICPTATDWSSARNQCRAMGMDLVGISSDAENTFVRGLINSLPQGPTGKWWMGYNDIAVEGAWGWVDGSPNVFSKWYPGQPSNSGNEDCGEFLTLAEGQGWNDAPCTFGRGFVCEEAPSGCTTTQVYKEVSLPIRFSSEPMQGTVYFWEINRGSIAKISDDGTLAQNVLNSNGRCVACHSVSSDGKTLVAQLDGGNGNGGTFNPQNGAFTYERGGANQVMAVSPDGYWSLWNDWGLLSPSNASQTPSQDYYKGVIPGSEGRMVAPAWSPDGKWIAWTRRENGGWYVDFPNGDLYLTPFNDKRPIDRADDAFCNDLDYNGNTYAFCRLGRTWLDARNYCLSRGMDLTTISDLAENSWLSSTANTLAVDRWWIGLNDMATEGNFVWASGAPKPFTRWDGGEPNNVGNEDCVEMYSGTSTWNDMGCGTGRYFICEGSKTWNYFGNTSMIAGADGAWDTNVFPSFSPDSQYVIYQAANAVRTRSNYGRLKLLDRASPAQKVDLYNANTATVMAASGAVSAVPDQDSIAYEPTFSPTESGGYYWAVFVSNRWYGNTIHPTWGVVKPGAGHLKDTGKKQLWVTAIPKNPGLASDPSTPPFWLPGQEYNNENMRGFFAKTPCKTSGQACKWDEDCCGNANGSALCVLDQPVTPAATRHCGSFTPGQCIQQGQACTDSSQCCQSPAAQECIQGLCTVPVALPFYTPAPFTRTYDSLCPSGTRVSWRNISWKGLTPGDSSIEVFVQTGDSDADINAMPPQKVDPLPAAQCASGFKCGDSGAALAKLPSISRLKLKATFMLNPTSDGATPPTLSDWKQEYDCLPSE